MGAPSRPVTVPPPAYPQAYYPANPAYGPYPTYPPYPPTFPPYAPYPTYAYGPRRSGKPTAAGVLWVFVALRDLFFLTLTAIWWSIAASSPFTVAYPFAFVNEPAAMLAVAAVGLGASVAAAACEFTRTRHALGSLAGAVALCACVTPGLILGFGGIGVAMSAIALVLHLASRSEFAAPAEPSPTRGA